MIKMKSNYLFFLTIIFIPFSSCSKGDSSSSIGVNSLCTLSASYIPGKWQIEKLEIKENGVFRDITSQFELCDRDDYFLFKSDGTYSRVESGTVCSISHTETGSWSFVNGRFYSNGTEEIVTIINCNKCVRELTNSQTYRYTMNRLQ